MSDLQTLREIGTMKVYQVNDSIFRQNEIGDEIFIVLSGQIGIYIQTPDGSRQKVSQLESGDFFGEMSLFEEIPRNTSAIAESNTTLISITKQNFQSIICDPESIAYKIMQNLSNQLNQLYSQLLDSKSLNQSNFEPINEPVKAASNSVTASIQTNPSIENNSPDSNTGAVGSEGIGIIIPEGHKKYGLTAPGIYQNYLIKTQVKCPVCAHSFEGRKPFTTKLQTERTDPDFRKHYKDFEPLWYSLFTCPHCLYTNYHTEYDGIPNYKVQAILTKTTDLIKNNDFQFSFTEPRTIDQVFTSYYLALYCAQAYNASSIKLGKLWLQLSWLYQDVADEEMYKKAATSALDYYYKAIYMSDTNLSVEQEQQCYLLLGELYLVQGDEKAAIKHFYSAIKKDVGKDAFNQIAEERLHDIRKDKLAF